MFNLGSSGNWLSVENELKLYLGEEKDRVFFSINFFLELEKLFFLSI